MFTCFRVMSTDFLSQNSWTHVTADLDFPPTPRIWTPQSRSASRYGSPFADLDPPENKRSFA